MGNETRVDRRARSGALATARMAYATFDRVASGLVSHPWGRSLGAPRRGGAAAPSGPHVVTVATRGSLGDDALWRGTMAGAAALGGRPQAWVPGRVDDWPEHPGERPLRSLDDVVWPHLPRVRRDAVAAFGADDTVVIGADTVGGDYTHGGIARRVEILRASATSGRRAALVNFSLGEVVSPTARALLRSLPDDVGLWARDELSRRRACDIVGREVGVAPDVGALAPAEVTPAVERLRERTSDYVAVVPNAHFTTLGWVEREELIRLWVEIVVAVAASAPVVVVPHDLRPRPGDVALAQEVAARSGATVEVVVPGTAGEAKAALGGAASVLSARMHGCVAALSEGVGCVGIEYLGKFQGQFDWYPGDNPVLPLDALRTPQEVVAAVSSVHGRRSTSPVSAAAVGWLGVLAPEGRDAAP